MKKQPWRVAVGKSYGGLTDDLISSEALSMESCFSTHYTKPQPLDGMAPEDIREWLDDAEYHKANMIFVNFDRQADAKAFASVSDGQLMG